MEPKTAAVVIKTVLWSSFSSDHYTFSTLVLTLLHLYNVLTNNPTGVTSKRFLFGSGFYIRFFLLVISGTSLFPTVASGFLVRDLKLHSGQNTW